MQFQSLRRRALLGLLPLLAVAGSARAEPFRLAVAADGLVASSATARGQVIFFGVARVVDPDDVVNVVPRLEVRTDDDGDGRVTLPFDGPAPLRSTWAAVDLTAGTFDVAVPEGFRLQRVNFRGRGLGKRPDGRDSVLDLRGMAELLVVRPGVGGWALRLGDGGPGDEDGRANGRLEAALDRMTPLPGSPAAPQTFLKDDVVLLIDPNLLEITLVKVPHAL